MKKVHPLPWTAHGLHDINGRPVKTVGSKGYIRRRRKSQVFLKQDSLLLQVCRIAHTHCRLLSHSPAVLSGQHLVAQDSVSTLRHIHYSLSMMCKATVSASHMIWRNILRCIFSTVVCCRLGNRSALGPKGKEEAWPPPLPPNTWKPQSPRLQARSHAPCAPPATSTSAS